MKFYIKGHQNYQWHCQNFQESLFLLSKIGSLDFQLLVVFMLLNPIKVKPGPGRPGLNEKSCQIDMNRLNLFSIGDFSSWSLLYPLKKLFLQYHHKNFEKSGPKVRRLPLELGKKHELTSVSPIWLLMRGQIGSKIKIFEICLCHYA